MQELTLFGGWATALIPQQIDNGVSIIKGTVSLSISTIAPDTDFSCIYQTKWSYGQFFNLDFDWVMRSLCDLAFVRHMEVWGFYSPGIITRGLLAKTGFKRSFAGKIGSANDARPHGGSVGRVDGYDKTWRVTNWGEFYKNHRDINPVKKTQKEAMITRSHTINGKQKHD